MLGINKGRKKFVVVSCSHGHLINKAAAEAVLKFIDDYKPSKVIHLGDFIDMSAFMGGGDKDDSSDIKKDLDWGIDFLTSLRPSIVFLGNHEERLYHFYESSKKETIKFAARIVIDQITKLAKGFKAELVPYGSIYDAQSWRVLGNTAFGHGYLYNENAARDHAEMLGMPVVFGHIHRVISQPARVIGAPSGFSVGCLCDIPAMHYAGRARATVAWDMGFGWGEYSETDCEIKLERIKSWQKKEIQKMK